ncbi:MAG: IclR family transcriptional regulator C-terminal domain-containing protein [Xanthobacteraceae bacterium]
MKLVRGLQRGVAVIRELTRAQACTLAELNTATKLPKATLLRLLRTLEMEGIVWRSLGDGAYRYRGGALVGTKHDRQRLAECSGPHLAELQKTVLWPSDLAVRRGSFMELVETSRGLASLSLSRDRLGKRLDFAASAIGRAYLAFCPAPERERIIDYIAAHPESRVALGPVDRVELKRALEEARRNGFATRDPSLVNGLWRLDLEDDHLDAIAVPIVGGTRIIGCLNVVWLRHLRLKDTIIKNHLADLQDAAAAIAATMRAALTRRERGRRGYGGGKPMLGMEAGK